MTAKVAELTMMQYKTEPSDKNLPDPSEKKVPVLFIYANMHMPNLGIAYLKQ